MNSNKHFKTTVNEMAILAKNYIFVTNFTHFYLLTIQIDIFTQEKNKNWFTLTQHLELLSTVLVNTATDECTTKGAQVRRFCELKRA